MSETVKLISLGCPKNSVDSEQMLGYLRKEGFVPVQDPSEARIIVINTCGFIESAKKESLDTILEMAQWKEEGKCRLLVVAGCLVQKYATELAEELPEVDLFLGTGDLASLVDKLKSLQPGQHDILVGDPNAFLYDESIQRLVSDSKNYAYLKIADGCNNSCTFCVIPSLRGAYRSRKEEDIVNEARELTSQGVKELILVAQDTAYYGKDITGTYRLSALLKELVKIPNLMWIRLLYCYPERITEELLETIQAEEKICSYLDLPLQHASESVLKAMGRPFSAEKTRQLLAKIRKKIPDITLRSTFIVGFPGESPQDFQHLLDFLEEEQLERAGFFTYSAEPDTPAYNLPRQVSAKTKQKRLEKASQVQEKILAAKQAQQVNKIVQIIVDGPSEDYDGLWEGRTKGDAPEIDGIVYFQNGPETRTGDIINIKVTHSQDFALMGVINYEFGQ